MSTFHFGFGLRNVHVLSAAKRKTKKKTKNKKQKQNKTKNRSKFIYIDKEIFTTFYQFLVFWPWLGREPWEMNVHATARVIKSLSATQISQYLIYGIYSNKRRPRISAALE